MTHEGRMARGEEKFSKGLQDIETQYYLDNKPKSKPTRKGAKKMSEEETKKEEEEETKEEEDVKSD